MWHLMILSFILLVFSTVSEVNWDVTFGFTSPLCVEPGALHYYLLTKFESATSTTETCYVGVLDSFKDWIHEIVITFYQFL